MSGLLHPDYQADYQKRGQRWVTTLIRPKDSQYGLPPESLPIATEEEGEDVLIQRIRERINQDIAERRAASERK